MADAYAIMNPKRALKRREEEADAGTAADAAPETKPADEPAARGVQMPKGKPAPLTPEEQARRAAQFRALQRKQRTQVL